MIGSKIKSENKNKLKKIINDEFSKVKNNKIDVQAFEVIKQNIKNSEKITRESTEKIVNFYREDFFTYGRVRNYQESLKILDTISIKDLTHIAKKILFLAKRNYRTLHFYILVFPIRINKLKLIASD